MYIVITAFSFSQMETEQSLFETVFETIVQN